MYQSSSGGRIVVPLENESRIIGGSSTPRFAKMVSWKYAQMSASKVEEDLALNHGRKASRKLIQKLGEEVGEIAREKEFEWSYELPQMSEVVTHVSIGRDGTTTPIVKEGYRETMCGTLSFYSAQGQRMHTIYAACAPEAGKASFDRVMDMELEVVKKRYPKVKYIGLADGARNNWTYLEERTEVQILDFFHAADHLTQVSQAMARNEAAQKQWAEEACHDLKNKRNGAKLLLRELKARQKQLGDNAPEVLAQNITYFENNLLRMNYVQFEKAGYPIGSGVTEAACKVVAKQRLSNSGMRWTADAAQHILLLRGLICTNGRWEQFWKHIDHFGP